MSKLYNPERVTPRGWRDWYQLERWRKRARYQLRIEPFCRLCLARGIPVAATVCDHIEPHHGDWNKFWLGATQSLCASCHSSAKKQIETLGYAPGVGPDGWPLDPRHPVYQHERQTAHTDHSEGSGGSKNSR
jgi:hypothetical protein